MPNLKEFIAEISSQGIAKKNTFDCVISYPLDFSNVFNGVSNTVDASLKKSMSLRVQSCDLPERTFNLARRASRGVPVFLPIGSETTPLQVTYLSGKFYDEYKLLSLWNSLIMDNKSQISNFPKVYYGSADLCYPNIESPELHIKFLDLYPKNLPTITGDKASKNELTNITVTFQYKRFLNETIGEN